MQKASLGDAFLLGCTWACSGQLLPIGPVSRASVMTLGRAISLIEQNRGLVAQGLVDNSCAGLERAEEQTEKWRQAC
jgi:hypothetical protein